MPINLDEKQTGKLQRMLAVMDSDNVLTKEDFVNSFQKVVDLFLITQKQQGQAIADLQATYANLLNKLRNDHTTSLSDLKKQTNELFVGEQMRKMLSEHKKMMTVVDEKLATIKDGKRGEQGLQGERGLPGNDGSPDASEKIRNKLEMLIGEERLDYRAIKGLENLVKKTKEVGKFMGGVLQVGVRFETPLGVVDGQNRTFTVFNAIKYIVVDGVTYFEDNGYAVSGSGSGKTITTTVAPNGYIRAAY